MFLSKIIVLPYNGIVWKFSAHARCWVEQTRNWNRRHGYNGVWRKTEAASGRKRNDTTENSRQTVCHTTGGLAVGVRRPVSGFAHGQENCRDFGGIRGRDAVRGGNQAECGKGTDACKAGGKYPSDRSLHDCGSGISADKRLWHLFLYPRGAVGEDDCG